MGRRDLLRRGQVCSDVAHRQGLVSEEVIEAVLAGCSRAQRATGIVLNGIVVAMRNSPDSDKEARIAVRYAALGLVGFDLAGPEHGYPASGHQNACRIPRHGGLGLTIHAGLSEIQ